MLRLHRASIRCIAFDTVGTLLYADPPVPEVYAEVGKRFGSQKKEREIAESFPRCFEAAEAASHAEGLRTNESYERRWWRAIVAEVLDDVRDLDGCFSALFEHFGCPESWRCYDDVPHALDRLRDTGYSLALTSNFDARLYRLREGIEPLRHLSPVIVSTEVGYRKPHGAFFASISDRANLPASEVLYVGDHLKNDHVGAKNAGLKSVWLRRDGLQAEGETVGDLITLARWLTEI